MSRSVSETIGVLSNLLTSLSLIAAASLFFLDFYESRTSDVQATIIKSSNKEVTLFLTNTGGKDIVIRSAKMIVPEYDIANTINLSDSDVLIKAGETLTKKSSESDLQSTVLLESVVSDLNPNVSETLVGKTKCILEVDFVNVEGNKFKRFFDHLCFAGSVGDRVSG